MKFCIIILTYNEEANLNACLDSLSGLSADIFAVDSFSTDATVSILQNRGIAFIQHPFENYSQQRNWAQQNCPFHSEWVLHLDAGERLSPELRHWLAYVFQPQVTADGFLLSRRTYFMNRWIRHGGHYPSYHLRLFRRGKGHCEAKAYDQHFICAGNVQKVPAKADLIDHVASNLADFTAGHTRWALFEAIERVCAHDRAGEVRPVFWGTPVERKRWLKRMLFDRSPLFIRAFLYFIYRYIIRFGFLDGLPGLVFHFLQGCWFRFLIDSAVLEIRRKQTETGLPTDQIIGRLYGPRFIPKP